MLLYDNMSSYYHIITFYFSDKTKKIWLYNHKEVYENIKHLDILYLIKHLNKFFDNIENNTKKWIKHPIGALALLILLTEYPYYTLIKNQNIFGNIIYNKDISKKLIKYIVNKSYNKLQKQVFYVNYINFDLFSTNGVIKRDNNYYYIKLEKKWHDNAHVLVNWIVRNNKILPSLITNFIEKKGSKHEFRYIVPLSPIGPHITVNPDVAILNQKINFKIKQFYTVDSYNSTAIAAFCPKKSKYYILKWFLLEVDIPQKLKPAGGLPHITLASYVAINK